MFSLQPYLLFIPCFLSTLGCHFLFFLIAATPPYYPGDAPRVSSLNFKERCWNSLLFHSLLLFVRFTPNRPSDPGPLSQDHGQCFPPWGSPVSRTAERVPQPLTLPNVIEKKSLAYWRSPFSSSHSPPSELSPLFKENILALKAGKSPP